MFAITREYFASQGIAWHIICNYASRTSGQIDKRTMAWHLDLSRWGHILCHEANAVQCPCGDIHVALISAPKRALSNVCLNCLLYAWVVSLSDGIYDLKGLIHHWLLISVYLFVGSRLQTGPYSALFEYFSPNAAKAFLAWYCYIY